MIDFERKCDLNNVVAMAKERASSKQIKNVLCLADIAMQTIKCKCVLKTHILMNLLANQSGL